METETVSRELKLAFSVLGLAPGASLQQCNEARKTLSKIWHPDVHVPGSAKHLEAVEKQKEINAAYDLLKQSDIDRFADKKTEPAAAPPAANMEAQFAQAREIENGGDLLKAMETYKRLASGGHASAQFRLGYLYFDSIMKDVPQAAYWWQRAAEQGHASAQYNLALMYERGIGMPVDMQKATHWFREAALNGDRGAKAKVATPHVPASSPINTSGIHAAHMAQTPVAPHATLSEQPPTSNAERNQSGAFSEQAGRAFIRNKNRAS